MPFRVKYGNLFLVFVIVLPVMTLIFTFLYHAQNDTSERVFNIVYDNAIDEKEQQFDNFVLFLHEHHDGNMLKTLGSDPALRRHLEEHLALLLSDRIKYLYVLFRDDEGKFRYLLDASSDLEERGEFGQRFDPQTDAWEIAYRTGVPQMRQQHDIDTLWTTYIKPVTFEGKVVALLGVDFANKEFSDLNAAINPINELSLRITLFLSILLIVGYIQLFLHYQGRQKSYIDPLTQVFNRKYILENKRALPLHEFQILLIDVDNFKQVNDAYGLEIGDLVLRAIAAKLRSATRKDDLLIRYSGEEFMLLYRKQNSEHCVKTAARILRLIRNDPIIAGGHYIHTTVSVGVNPSPEDSATFDEALKVAEDQLQRAKQNGRDRYEVFNAHLSEAAHVPLQVSDVEQALHEGRLTWTFQPIVHTGSLEIDAYEVLIRLIDASEHTILPEHFLEAVRATPIYIDLTRQVLNKTFELLGTEPVRVSTNLSMQDFLDVKLMDMIMERIVQNASLADRLIIEISDRRPVENIEQIETQIARFRNLGVKIALDNFGRGYTNFAHMMRLGIDLLKIDGEIVRNLHADRNRYHFVKTIHAFARDMHIATVAEAVESEAELLVLREIGVEFAQGYFVGEPGTHRMLERRTMQPGMV